MDKIKDFAFKLYIAALIAFVTAKVALKLLFYAIPRTCAELYPGLSVAALIAASATASWQLIGSNIAFLPPLIGFLLSILIVEIHSAYKEEIERRE